MTKIFFPVNVEWSAKNLWKIISADETSRNKRYSGCILQVTPSKLEIQCKRLCIFYLILVGVLYCLLRTWGWWQSYVLRSP